MGCDAELLAKQAQEVVFGDIGCRTDIGQGDILLEVAMDKVSGLQQESIYAAHLAIRLKASRLLHHPGGETIEGKLLLYAGCPAIHRLSQLEYAVAQPAVAYQWLLQSVRPGSSLSRRIGKQRRDFVGGI